jgi:hypothetical protein
MMRLTTLLVLLWLAATSALDAQDRGREFLIALAPGLLHHDDDYYAAARFNFLAATRAHEASRAFPRSRYGRVEARATVATDADASPDPLSFGLAGGIAWSLAKPRVVTFDPANVDAPGSAMEFDYGDLALGAQAHIETNQPRTETRAGLSAELIYTHDKQRGFWPFVPGVYAIVGVARSLASEARQAQFASETESYVRLGGGATWHISADRTWTPRLLRPVWLHGEIEVYREDGGAQLVAAPGGPREVEVFDGTRVALGAAYRLLGTERRVVDEVFIRWTNGETPTIPAPRKAWMLGIVLSP